MIKIVLRNFNLLIAFGMITILITKTLIPRKLRRVMMKINS